MGNLYEIIGSILAAVLVGLAAYLVPRAREWLAANTDAATEEAILRLVRSFVRAAEQMYRKEGSGAERKKFVLEQLQEAGIEITETVLNMIEGEVWAVNQTSGASSMVTVTADGVTSTVSKK